MALLCRVVDRDPSGWCRANLPSGECSTESMKLQQDARLYLVSLAESVTELPTGSELLIESVSGRVQPLHSGLPSHHRGTEGPVQ
jgi:hypothetical protein